MENEGKRTDLMEEHKGMTHDRCDENHLHEDECSSEEMSEDAEEESEKDCNSNEAHIMEYGP
jgi:hypothetical protein